MLNLPQYIAMINLPHYTGVSWAILQIIFRRTFKTKLLRLRGWAMYRDKDKYLYFINYLSPEAQHRQFNSQSPKSEKWLNLPRSPLHHKSKFVVMPTSK